MEHRHFLYEEKKRNDRIETLLIEECVLLDVQHRDEVFKGYSKFTTRAFHDRIERRYETRVYLKKKKERKRNR